MRQKLDVLGDRRGTRLRVFFPHEQPVRIMETTGNSRPAASGPCEFDWELKCGSTGRLEWVPGWYIAVRAT